MIEDKQQPEQAVEVCPHCGSEEFDLIKFERGYEGRGWFNRCYHCETEWEEA